MDSTGKKKAKISINLTSKHCLISKISMLSNCSILIRFSNNSEKIMRYLPSSKHHR